MKEKQMLLKLLSKKTKVLCAVLMIMGFFSAWLASECPVILGDLLNGIVKGNIGYDGAGMTALFTFAGIFALSEGLTTFQRVFMDCTISANEAEVREKSVEKLLKMPVSYCHGVRSGERAAEVNQGVDGLSKFIKIVCNDAFSIVVTSICTLYQILNHAPAFVVGIMLLYLAIAVMISIFQIRSQNKIREQTIRGRAAMDGEICESINNLELIRSMNAVECERGRIHTSIFRVFGLERKHKLFMGKFDCMKQICGILFQTVILFVSLLMIKEGQMPAGAIITINLLFQQFMKPINDIHRFLDETASAHVKTKVLTNLMQAEADPVFSIASRPGSRENKMILLKDVKIMNPDRDKELAHYKDLFIQGDQITGIKGPSGCGKSTLLRAIERYYPYQGELQLFGRDLSSFSQQELADRIFYVPQKAVFVMGTIRENLVYGLSEDISDEVLLKALKLAEFTDNGSGVCKKTLDRDIGEKGAKLSGGEQQRLSLARAFLRVPDIFIMDESTANLDAQTAKNVLQNIEHHAKKHHAGIIYISHDDQVIERCDRVIGLQNMTQNMSNTLIRKEIA